MDQMSAAAPSFEDVVARQNFTLAIPAGIAAALIGAALWAMVTVVTHMKIGLAAIAIGYVVGQAIKAVGHGIDKRFGVLGAICALLGCVLGNAFSGLAFFADARHLDFGQLLAVTSPDLVVRLMVAFASPMDLLFYGIAIYEGYRFSFKYRRV